MRILKTSLAVIAGMVVWLLTVWILSNIIHVLGQIPILGALIYYPSDLSWAQIVIPTIAAIEFGSLCSIKICGGAKAFFVSITIIYIIDITLMFVSNAFLWSELFKGIVAIGSACIGFAVTSKKLKEKSVL